MRRCKERESTVENKGEETESEREGKTRKELLTSRGKENIQPRIIKRVKEKRRGKCEICKGTMYFFSSATIKKRGV